MNITIMNLDPARTFVHHHRFALLASLLFVGIVSSAWAQQASFEIRSSPTVARTTGASEAVGELTLTSLPAPNTPQTIRAGATLSVTMIPSSVLFTNGADLDGNSVANDFMVAVSTNAANENANVQIILCAGSAFFGALPTAQVSASEPNKLNINFPAQINGVCQINIRELRVDIANSGLVFPQQVFALLTSSPLDAIRLSDNTFAMATPLDALDVTQVTSLTRQQCLRTRVGFNDPATQVIADATSPRIRLSERFTIALTTLAQEAAKSDTPRAPTNGTRIDLVFSNLSLGTRLGVPASVTNGDFTLSIVGENIKDSPSNQGSVTFTYEVTSSNALNLDFVDIPISLSFDPDIGNNRPAVGSILAQARLSPLRTETVAGNLGRIVRFDDPLKPVVPMNVITVARCVTVLLFPFVTNQVGIDTGIAIANTTEDEFNTPLQSGTCTLNFHGFSKPAAPFVTPPIPAGTVFSRILSSFAPGFQGYLTVTCGFQFAHGFAFIADRNFASIAQGYLALIIPDPSLLGGRQAIGSLHDPFGIPVPAGENLGAKRRP